MWSEAGQQTNEAKEVYCVKKYIFYFIQGPDKNDLTLNIVVVVYFLVKQCEDPNFLDTPTKYQIIIKPNRKPKLLY